MGSRTTHDEEPPPTTTTKTTILLLGERDAALWMKYTRVKATEGVPEKAEERRLITVCVCACVNEFLEGVIPPLLASLPPCV